MKHKYESTLDENFNRAFELCSSEHNYELLIDLLKTGNIPEKQYSALFINELKSQEDAKIFISNLVNCDGKIREAVALKISEFIHIEQYREYFSNYPEIFAQSTIDINANISRIIIDSLVYLNDNPSFGGKYSKILQKYIQDAFDGLDKIIYRDKKYTINKQLFKLYWSLEGLYNYSQYIERSVLKDILEKTSNISEYTVREKAAKFLRKYKNEPMFVNLISKFEQDENYYVKSFFKQ